MADTQKQKAKTWTMADAITVLKNFSAGDMSFQEDAADIMRRFPRIALLAVQNPMYVLGILPPYVTVRKLEAIVKTGKSDASPDEADDTVELDDEIEIAASTAPSSREKVLAGAVVSPDINPGDEADLDALLS